MRARALGSIVLLAAAWLLLFRGPLRSLAAMATFGALVQGAVLVGGLGVLARGRMQGPLELRARGLPLALALVAAGLHVVNGRTAQIDLASGALMVLGAWGLLGLWLPTQRWVQSLPLAIAGLCALPIGAALDLWVGFPLRTATAQLTHGLLAPWLGGTLATETIIVLDGAGVQVDLPCSGVRSLFTGAIFWAAASTIERRTIGAKWCVAAVVFAAVLCATNFARVVMLVLLHRFAPPLVGDALHLPLGVAAFVIACASGWLLLRRVPRSADHDEHVPPRPLPLLAVLAPVLALAAIPTRAPTLRAPATIELQALAATPLAPTEAEARLFRARGADAAGKWSVVHGRVRAQLAIVRSRSWRAQHRPDVCHRAAGRRVEDERAWLIAPGFPVRVARLSSAAGDAWGVYWFQSADEITEDHGARVWSALDGEAEPWAMVSLTIGTELALEDPEVVALLQRTRHEVDAIVRATEEPPR